MPARRVRNSALASDRTALAAGRPARSLGIRNDRGRSALGWRGLRDARPTSGAFPLWAGHATAKRLLVESELPNARFDGALVPRALHREPLELRVVRHLVEDERLPILLDHLVHDGVLFDPLLDPSCLQELLDESAAPLARPRRNTEEAGPRTAGTRRRRVPRPIRSIATRLTRALARRLRLGKPVE